MATRKKSTTPPQPPAEKILYCDFCAKSQNEVNKLIAGPKVFICDECIDLCNQIMRDGKPDNPLVKINSTVELMLGSIEYMRGRLDEMTSQLTHVANTVQELKSPPSK